jgi:hypothetical protein
VGLCADVDQYCLADIRERGQDPLGDSRAAEVGVGNDDHLRGGCSDMGDERQRLVVGLSRGVDDYQAGVPVTGALSCLQVLDQ